MKRREFLKLMGAVNLLLPVSRLGGIAIPPTEAEIEAAAESAEEAEREWPTPQPSRLAPETTLTIGDRVYQCSNLNVIVHTDPSLPPWKCTATFSYGYSYGYNVAVQMLGAPMPISFTIDNNTYQGKGMITGVTEGFNVAEIVIEGLGPLNVKGG